MRDEAGFTAFVAARGAALLRLGWLMTTDANAAEDLVQEALARVVPRWDRIEPGARESYVRMAMRSIWIDGWRRRNGRTVDVVAHVPDAAEDDHGLARAPSRLALGEALARLTPRQRAVLVLRFYEDLTEVQTAALMGCTTSTVKSQTRHALQRLRVLAPDLAEAFGRSEASGRSGASGRSAATAADATVTGARAEVLPGAARGAQP